MNVNDILQKTYDILEERGWCQGVMQQPDGKVCLEGAFRLAATGSLLCFPWSEDPSATEEAWLRLCRTVNRWTGHPTNTPWTWNDHPNTTVEDVKLLLKEAIHGDT